MTLRDLIYPSRARFDGERVSTTCAIDCTSRSWDALRRSRFDEACFTYGARRVLCT
jgi:hypothetical protein